MPTILVPGATAFSEWGVSLGTPPRIATCVEVSEMLVNYLTTHGRLPLSNAEDIQLAQDLIARGQADPDGASTYLAASQQMARLGIPNTPYGADWFTAHDFGPPCRQSLDDGAPVLFGLSSAYQLKDDWTGRWYNGGVNGHAVVLVGYDDTGAICADPNTPQAGHGQFVHYTWDNLKAGGGQWPSMVIVEAGTHMAWTTQPDGSGKDDQGHTCGGAVMAELARTGLAASDGLISESDTYYDASHAFMPLANGAIVRAVKDSAGQWSADTNGAQVAVDLLHMVAALTAAAQHSGGGGAPNPAIRGELETAAASIQSALAALPAALA